MILLPNPYAPMSSTDITILDQILVEEKAERDPEASDAEFLEFFSAEQILRDYSLDPEEIRSGVVGQESNSTVSGTDGGIDSMYLLVNGKLIRDLEQARALSDYRKNIVFDVAIIQSRKGSGFGLEVLNRLSNTSESIFQIEKQIADFAEKYNEPLLNIIECFRESHRALITRHPEINVYFYYIASGDSSSIHSDIAGKARELEAKVPQILSTIKICKVLFVGARDIIDIYRRPRKSSFPLKCLNSIGDSKGGYIALVELGEYFKLITADDGQLREYLFESNVRDYEGDIDVNKQIRSTLENTPQGAGFWWLNNGITILAEKVGGHPQELTLDDPRIVNGLQTSQEVFDFLRKLPAAGTPPDQRHTMVRILESEDQTLQDKIIRATNSQTKIPIQYLRASDELQRDIEQVFRSSGLHYDRRKNSWRKSGHRLDSVIGMTELAQSVAAIVLQEPDHARARPSRYFKDYYEKLFNSKTPLETYVTCARLRKRAEAFLKRIESDRKDRNNLLFYLLMAVRPLLLRKQSNKKTISLRDVEVAKIPDDTFQEALAIVRPIYTKHGADDKAAKGVLMPADLKAALKNKFSRKKKTVARRVAPSSKR